MRTVPMALFLLWLCGHASGWEHYGASLGGDRYVPNSIIHKQNVKNLAFAWQYRTGDYSDGTEFNNRPSSFKATPILVGTKLIFSTGLNTVIAVDARSGKFIWRYDPKVDFSKSYSETYTSRGVSFWTSARSSDACHERVFLGTLDARLIAISAATGSVCDEFGDNGVVDLSKNVKNYRRGQYSLTSPVTVVNDVVIVGSSIGDNGAAKLEPGFVRGFSAKTGEEIWRWHPIKDPKVRSKTGAANVWSVISADPKLGLAYLPTTSPSPDFYGGKRLGNNDHANSLVALNISTGQAVWQFQTVHHDLWDYDNAAQPLLTTIQQGEEEVPVVVLATKMGFVYVLHGETGKPMFPVVEQDVSDSDVPGEKSSPTQPFPTKPPPLHPIEQKDLELWSFTPEHERVCREMLGDATYEGIFTPPSLGGTVLFPGNAGGTNWGSMAVNKNTNVATLVMNRLPTVVRLIPRSEFNRRREDNQASWDIQFTEQNGTPFGMARYDLYNRQTFLPCTPGPWSELIAIDLNQGAVVWRKPLGVFPSAKDHPLAKHWGGFNSGGPLMTSTGVVFVAARFGKALIGYSEDTGETLWRHDLPARPHATPMSFVIDNTQYVVLALGGPSDDQPANDYLMAFKLTR
ncbi:MAG: PQQ-binding-like beta-propeller repeat protein [Pseudomonadota bacterium]